MQFEPTPLRGVYLVHTSPKGDSRGRLTRVFCSTEFAASGRQFQVVQTNLTRTNGVGTVRGLHFQRPPDAEAKLIRCLSGRIFDVAVDLRAHSSSFLKWYAVELSEDSETELLIPEGCAHGFQVLSDTCALLYHHTAPYSPQSEGGIRCDDPALGIRWPVPITHRSERDSSFPLIDESFASVRL
jgi:dTDP-4-dehydrorhamnose 3,5-epimerase